MRISTGYITSCQKRASEVGEMRSGKSQCFWDQQRNIDVSSA